MLASLVFHCLCKAYLLFVYTRLHCLIAVHHCCGSLCCSACMHLGLKGCACFCFYVAPRSLPFFAVAVAAPLPATATAIRANYIAPVRDV